MPHRWRTSATLSNGSSRVWKRKTGCSTPGSGRSSPITRWAMPWWHLRCRVSVHKVSIIPRGIGSLGYTIQRPTEDRFLMTREELENKMAVSLGGRAAELIVFGHLSTGAADDLRRVTDIARSMVTRYGMSDKLGNVAYDRDPQTFVTGPNLPSPPHERDYAEKTAATVDEEVRANVDKAFQRALDLLKERRAVLDRTALRLLEKETLEEAELTQLANHPEPRSSQAAAE